MKDMIKEFARMVFALAIITALAGLGLGMVYDVTAKRIEEQKAAAQTAALGKALPGCEVTSGKLSAGGVDYWMAKTPDGKSAYGFVARTMGYQSEIVVMVGIDEAADILGMSIISQAETPGLGARLQEVAVDTTIWQALFGQAETPEAAPPAWFAQQFVGLSIEKPVEVEKGTEWKAMAESEQAALRKRNNISSLSGATISSRAVVSAVKQDARRLLDALKEAAR